MIIIEVRCCLCSWNGRIGQFEIDDACPGCGEWECLAEVEPEERACPKTNN